MVGVWPAAPLGYHDNMPDPLTSLVLVLALAVGLGASIVVAQYMQTGQAIFYRYYLTHILLFNLLILAGLVFRYLQPLSLEIHPASLPAFLILMAGLKLGWLYAFVISTRLLTTVAFPETLAKRLGRTGLVLFLVYALVVSLAWFGSFKTLFQGTMMGLEIVVLGGALVASLQLMTKARRIPAGSRRYHLLWFAGFHLGLLLIVMIALLASWIRPGPEEFAQLVVNGGFLLLFNLFPPLWVRNFQPGPGAPISEKFDSLGITRREKEIVLLIQAGKTNQEIADGLFISVATVKDHNNNLFRKTGVRNRIELANLFR